MEEQEKTQPQIDRNRYRSSFTATLLFSGVQIYQIIIRIVKSKFVALFIGPAGMGIQSLLHSTSDTISAATSFGLNTSSVKTIAAANRDGNSELIARSVKAQRRLIFITGLMGLIICSTLAPIWSLASFGNTEYTLSFIAVSIIILFDQLNKGELALLQGLQQRKQLARANLIGQTLNAAVTIPLYYFYGTKAIVAALILGSLISLVISRYYSMKIRVNKVEMTWRETFSYGKEMLKLGFFLSLQYMMGQLVMWIIRSFVSNRGGLDDVGLYSAGTAIITSYIGLVFAAMATDYFPRLSATKNNEEMGQAVRTQAELTILLLTPLIIAFLVFIKPVIILLYSYEFLPIENMMYWSVGAVLLQAMGWAMSYTLLAKAKPSYFFLNELLSTIWGLPIKLISYSYWGLTGFGMATMIVYAFYLLQVSLITKKLFGLSYDWTLWKLFILLNLTVVMAVLIKLIASDVARYVCGTLLLMVVGGFVSFQLNKKIGLKEYICTKLKK